MKFKKKHKLEKGRENFYEILGKFYFTHDKILNNFGTNFGKTGIFVNK